jgi:hypothetical protein
VISGLYTVIGTNLIFLPITRMLPTTTLLATATATPKMMDVVLDGNKVSVNLNSAEEDDVRNDLFVDNKLYRPRFISSGMTNDQKAAGTSWRVP